MRWSPDAGGVERLRPNYPGSSRRLDVLVDTEEVCRIVFLLHLGKTRIIGTERRLDHVRAFLAEEIQKMTAARVRPQCVCHLATTDVYQCPSRHQSCSMSIVIGLGHPQYASRVGCHPLASRR